MRNYLTIDIGTGNTKLYLFQSDGKILSSHTFVNKYYNDNKYNDALYFIPQELENKIIESIRILFKDYPDIKINGITSAAARQSIILIDKENNSYIGLPNIDNRGKEYLDYIQNKEDIYEITGKWVTEDFPAAKILGFRKIYSEEYKNIFSFTGLSEWVGYFLTGKLTMEPSSACESQLYNIHTNMFSKELAQKYGLESLSFPILKNSGENLGNIKQKYIEEFPQLKDAVFIVGGSDTQMALKSEKLPDEYLSIIAGTTTPIVAYSDKPILDIKERIWVDSNLSKKGYLIEVNPGATGLNYQRYKENFLKDYSYEDLEKEYEKIDEIKVTASLTTLNFSKKSPQKNGGFYMKNPFAEDLLPIDLGWAILGDIASSIYENILILEDVIGCNHTEIFGIGFSLKSKTLCQMISDLTQKKLILPYFFENGTSIGMLNTLNEYFNIENIDKEYKQQYKPQKDQLIHEYYRQWKNNRELR